MIIAILGKVAEICVHNVDRIEKQYNEMSDKIKMPIKDEQQLVELKNLIAENDVNLAKLNTEILSVYKFMNILEDYNYTYNIDRAQQFWNLKAKPGQIKEALVEGKNVVQQKEEQFMGQLEKEK